MEEFPTYEHENIFFDKKIYIKAKNKSFCECAWLEIIQCKCICYKSVYICFDKGKVYLSNTNKTKKSYKKWCCAYYQYEYDRDERFWG